MCIRPLEQRLLDMASPRASKSITSVGKGSSVACCMTKGTLRLETETRAEERLQKLSANSGPVVQLAEACPFLWDTLRLHEPI